MSSQSNKRGSPFKKIEPSKRSPKLAKQNNSQIVVWGFPKCPLELYSFSNGPNKDGYLWSYRKHVDGDETTNIPQLAENGFTAYYKRRVSVDCEEVQIGDDDYPRYYLGRFVPEMEVSTRETRLEGLRLLKSFVNNRDYTRFPPGNTIPLIDETDDENFGSLDHFLMSEPILELMIDLLEVSSRNVNFYNRMPELARLFFCGAPPRMAVTMYGYPSAQRFGNQGFARAGPVANLLSQLSEPGKNNTDQTAAENRKMKEKEENKEGKDEKEESLLAKIVKKEEDSPGNDTITEKETEDSSSDEYSYEDIKGKQDDPEKEEKEDEPKRVIRKSTRNH